MNELIKQLALEAFQPINDITPEGVADRHTFDQAWFQHYNEKFAELIVWECIDIASHEDFDVMMKEGYPCSQTAKKIKQHFGVEE